jgi:hypothetical protein
MNKEHFWPRWLSEMCQIGKNGVRWTQGFVHPNAATIPLCILCNSKMGRELEGPVARIFRNIDKKIGFSDLEAELLIKWIWKFEGLAWNLANFDDPNVRYSPQWTLIERIFSDLSRRGRPEFALAIAEIAENDKEFSDWPIGLDSPITKHNAIFVSGVFYKFAIMSIASRFSHLVPGNFTVFRLKMAPDHERRYLLPTGFPNASEAVGVTVKCSIALAEAHESFTKNAVSGGFIITRPRPRIEFP